MINGLFETHINVSDLERSIAFYKGKLGLTVGALDQQRRIAFMWIAPPPGKPGEAMLGLWEKPKTEVVSQHFAFRTTVDDVLRAPEWLKARGLACHNFLKDGTDRPMVFGWMPAIATYFRDPDGHSLEFIAMLPGPARPALGVVSWERWQSETGTPPA